MTKPGSQKPAGKSGSTPMPTFAPGVVEAMLRAGAEHFAKGDLAKAAQIFRGLCVSQPHDARSFKLLGSTLFLQQKHADAVAAYEKALSLDDRDPYVLVALGELALVRVRLAEALRYFEKLRKVDPEGRHPASGRAHQLIEQHGKRLGG